MEIKVMYSDSYIHLLHFSCRVLTQCSRLLSIK